MQRRLFDEGAYPPEDLASSFAVTGDLGQPLADLAEVGRGPLQPTRRRPDVGHNGGERLADFMGDRGRKLAKRRDAVDVRKLGLRAIERLLRMLALGEVVVGLQRRDRSPALVRLQSPAAQRDDSRAIARGVDELALPPARAHELGIDRRERGGEFRPQQRVGNPAERLLARPPVALLRPSVPVGDGVIAVADENGIVRGIEQVGALAQSAPGGLVVPTEIRRDGDCDETDTEIDLRDGRWIALPCQDVARHRKDDTTERHQQGATRPQPAGRDQHHGDVEDREGEIQRRDRIDDENSGCERSAEGRKNDGPASRPHRRFPIHPALSLWVHIPKPVNANKRRNPSKRGITSQASACCTKAQASLGKKTCVYNG